jgi:hypothetical protein
LIDIVKRVEKLTIDNSPSICTAIGAVGTVTTAYLTAKATVKAVRIVDAEQKLYQSDYKMDIFDKAKLVWTLYIPPVGMCVVTVASIIGANRIGSRRAAAVAAAYSISEKAFSEYKEKVIEKVGEKKERAVRDDIAQDQVNRNPVGEREVIITGKGEVLCYDSLTGRYFNSNIESLRKAANDINKQILADNYASLSEFYDRIGLSNTTFSEEVGWNLDNMLELVFSTVLSEDDKPCISINYEVAPIRFYYRLQ